MVFMHHALRMVSIFSHVPWFKQLSESSIAGYP